MVKIMAKERVFQSIHFNCLPLADGVYACTHIPGGGAYSNCGIINLGDQTLLVDALDTLAAGKDLRQMAENLLKRPVQTIVLTHPHSDHWIGAAAFDAGSTLLSSATTQQVCLEWGAELIEEYQDRDAWDDYLNELQEQLRTEDDERVLAGLRNALVRTQHVMAEMIEFQPRYPDQTFDGEVAFLGKGRTAELRSYGPGHSEDDAVLLLPQDGIAFIGDIGFFAEQPFLGFCDIERHRQQLNAVRKSGFQVLVPGHGRVGNVEDIDLQLEYLDVMEDLVGSAVRGGYSLEEVLQIGLPEPFDKWLEGGMARFEINVRKFFEYFGGELPDEE
jgi:glyoxylase-like metal-dependent hydrolase (beta-lactamase superfamily II)